MRPAIRLGLLLALLATAAAGWAVDRHVDLTPRVTADFFFASDDPAIEPAHWIERSFVAGGPYLFVSVQGGDLRSPGYVRAVARLTERVAALPGVRDVLSITQGPSSLERAFEGPMWRRLLVDEASRSTLIIASLPGGEVGPALLARLEGLASDASNGDLTVRVSGSPYVSGQIARHLARDFHTYTLASFALFGAMILLVFRSGAVLLGTLVTCGSAILLTLLGNQLLGGSIGILTANLATIVFVLTQSHIVFLTANQRRLLAEGGRPEDAPWAAVRETLPASFWCMLTTLLGFASLTFVAAEPLRALGRGGVAGTGLAGLCAYLLYPPFLALSAGRRVDLPAAIARRLDRASARPWRAVGIGLAAACLGLAAWIPRLDTDPPLLAYFDAASELHEGLAFIDRTGGTSVLKLAVRDRGGGRLDDRGAYERLWALQRDLESLEAVGATVSLPVLVAEGRERSFLARLIGTRWLIELLTGDHAGRIGRSFVSESRRDALYLMRMREAARERPRQEILDEMHRLADRAGLEVHAVGGIFFLQGRMAELVGRSLRRGLAGLLACFVVIGVVAARSLRVGLCMAVGIALVPLSLLGGLAALAVPVDLISSPASNVCIGMAADSMIHLVASVRRHAASGTGVWRAWVAARREQGPPILLSTLVVCAGFSIFAFSSFPPNRRFGLSVVAGTVVAAAATLVLLPLLAGRPGAPEPAPDAADRGGPQGGARAERARSAEQHEQDQAGDDPEDEAQDDGDQLAGGERAADPAAVVAAVVVPVDADHAVRRRDLHQVLEAQGHRLDAVGPGHVVLVALQTLVGRGQVVGEGRHAPGRAEGLARQAHVLQGPLARGLDVGRRGDAVAAQEELLVGGAATAGETCGQAVSEAGRVRGGGGVERRRRRGRGRRERRGRGREERGDQTRDGQGARGAAGRRGDPSSRESSLVHLYLLRAPGPRFIGSVCILRQGPCRRETAATRPARNPIRPLAVERSTKAAPAGGIPRTRSCGRG